MNKTLKVILKAVVACAVIGGLGYGGYRFYQSKQAASASTADAVSYVKVQIGTGNLKKTVTGTGTISISKTEDITVNYPVTVTNVRVSAGEQVAVGDPLLDVDVDALNTAITSLEEELTTNNDSMVQLARSYDDSMTLTLSSTGRIKAIYGAAGDLVQNVMEKYGALMLLSMDGKMNVSIPAADLTVGQEVDVYDGLSKYDAVVESINNGTALVTFSDEKTLEGASVQVVSNSIIIGSGTAQINLPLQYTSTEQGLISKVYQSVNIKPTRGSSLFYLTQVPVSSEYATLQKQRDEILQKIKEAKAILQTGTIVSTVDGIISSVVSASNVEVAADTALCTLYAGDAKQMIVSVDELDITGVQVGQEVSIEMDAIADTTYNATVSYISQIGTSSSGVTTYNVTLDVQADDQLKIGMNGTATINVGDAEGVVLVPITALNTSKNGQYVWLYSDTISADSQDPGVKTIVTTGLSSDTYAEVKSGLKSGDYVMVTRTAGTSDSTNPMMGGMDMMQMPGGGEFTPPSGSDFTPPSGGNSSFPSGGGQRPGN